MVYFAAWVVCCYECCAFLVRFWVLTRWIGCLFVVLLVSLLDALFCWVICYGLFVCCLCLNVVVLVYVYFCICLLVDWCLVCFAC